MKRKIRDLRLFDQSFLTITGNRPAPTNDFPEFPRGQICQSIAARFETQVRNHPDKVAVTVGSEALTYDALNEYANRTAHVVLKPGRPGQIIALLFGQTIRMVVGLMGVLKAGKAYVPLDPTYPLNRLEYMLEDSQARVIVTDTANRKLAAALKDQVNKNILIIDINQIYFHQDIPRENPGIPIHPLTPAYILYTSGSTGKPKGVIQANRNVLHFTRVYTNALHIHYQDRLTLFSSYGFDAAQMDIYGALLNGASLYPFDIKREDSLSLLVDLLREEQITIFHSTPTLYRYFTDMLTGTEAFPHLRFIVLGGEPVFKKDVEKYQQFFPENCLFINGLGPTESTVTLQYFIDKQSEITRGAVPVGYPVEETEVFIINEKGEKARIYELGEIVYKSDYLAWGYLNEPQFTDERFGTGPLTGKGRVYRSGDLGRRLEDGSIEYVGRKDFQVKIRGYRIEPAEIESKLDHLPGISKSVVICQQDTGGENYLTAFYQMANGITVDENNLVNRLKKSLPNYMIPAAFCRIEVFPHTPTGKIDRKALAENKLAQRFNRPAYKAPRNETEKKLVETWSRILDIEKEAIGIDHNFFELGGHSLKATLMTTQIHKELNIKLPLTEIFKTPTIRDLAEYIKKSRRDIHEDIQPVEKRDYYLQSSAQERLYILQQMEPESTAYNMPLVIPLSTHPHMEKLAETFIKLIKRHESLRTSFLIINEEPVQRIHDQVEFELEYKKVEVEVKVEEEWSSSLEGTRGLAPLPKAPATRNSQPSTALINSLIRPFDLSKAPLLRVDLIHTPPFGYPSQEGSSEGKQFLFLDMHHIITDGTSQAILQKEFMALYSGEKLLPLKLQYKDFSRWQNSERQEELLKPQESYWLKAFPHDLPVLDLPIDYPRPIIQSFAGNTVNFILNEPETQVLKRISKETGTTLYMVILSMYTILLSRLSGQEDIIVGTPIATRRHADLERIIGMFVNTLAMRNFPSAAKSFKGFLKEVKVRTLEAYENQEYQFEDLVDKISPHRDTSRNPIFDVMFNLLNQEDYTGGILAMDGQGSYPYRHRRSRAKFDLNLASVDLGDRLFFRLEYCTQLFKPETIDKIIGYFRNIEAHLEINNDLKLLDLDILSQEEKAEILNFSGGLPEEIVPRETIHRWFETQVAQTPHHIALVGPSAGTRGLAPLSNAPLPVSASVTYYQLNRQSNQLAKFLRKQGVKRDTVVGLMVERSVEMIIGILAILKAGGAYLPLDAQYPGQRKKYMLLDSQVNLLLTDSDIEKNSYIPGNIHHIDLRVPPGHPGRSPYTSPHGDSSTLTLNSTSTSTSLIYVIYTSGSTGNPKGVLLEHGNLVNLFRFQYRYTNLDSSRILQFATLSFDASFHEIFTALLSGGTLYLINRETRTNIPALFEVIEKNIIKTVFLPMSLLKLIFNEDEYIGSIPRCLRHIQTAGEQVIVNDRFREYLKQQGVYLHNHYGPSETHVVTTLTMEPRRDISELPPIGKPVANTAIYLLDKNQHLVPVGVPGELYIGGSQVGRGYLNNPELTAERFCLRRPGGALFGKNRPPWPPPQKLLIKMVPGNRIYTSHTSYMSHISHLSYIYRSGDLARWLPDGNIEFLGRLDHQVKIRGFRVELGEIETRLLKHEAVKEAVVAAGEEENQGKYLCAYIIARHKVQGAELRAFLEKDLPDYMIPSYFVFLEKIPLTPSGKLDRKRLPGPELKDVQVYTAPRTSVEKKLAEIWSEVLGIEKVIIGIDHNFFELGGHSLKATLMTTKIHKELNVKLPLTEIFKTPRIRDLAEYIKKSTQDIHEDIQPVERRDYYLQSSAQKRLYILQQMDPESTAYNMPMIIPLSTQSHMEKLAETFVKLIKRHEILRTSFLTINEEPVQKVLEFENVEFKIEYKEVEVKVEEERSSVLEGTRGLAPLSIPATHNSQPATGTIENFIRPFDLSQAPLLRVGLMELPHTPAALRLHPSPAASTTHQGENPGNRYILMLDMHHIISDGVSHQVLAKDFMALYQEKWLPRLPIQYKDFARWQNKEKENLVQHEKYWLKEFKQEIPVLNLPTDFSRPALQSFAGNTIGFHIGKEEKDQLKTLILAEGVTMFMVLLAVFNVLLAKLSGQEDIVVGTGIEGRRHENLRPIVGMFVNTLALRNFPNPNISFKKFLEQLKRSCLEAFDHQDYQFEDLVDKLEVKRDSSRNPLFDVMFQFNNLQNPGGVPQRPGPQIPGFERKVSKFDLTLWAVEGAEEFLFIFEYCTKLFKKETIQVFIKYFQEITNAVLTNPAKKLAEIEAISIQRKKETLSQLNEELSKEVELIEKKGSILQEKLERKLHKFKNNTAIEYKNNVLTYSQLQERSNHIANWLIYKGIKKGTLIGVLIEDRMELILIMVGILKAGCVFVPFDSAYPRARLETMIDSTGIEFVIGDTDNFNKLSAPGKIGKQIPEFILFNHLLLNGNPSGLANKPGMRWESGDKVYVYFTSGTTGKPRAILGKNKSLLHFIHWEMDTFAVNRDFRFSQLTNPGFDAFLRDVLVPLCSGGTICIPGSKETSVDSNELINWVEKSRITLIHCVPGLFRLLNSPGLTRENFKALKFILLSGERIEPTDLANWYQVFADRIQLVNLWGTSETTLAKTCYFIHPEDINRERVPVGKPIPGAKVLILDQRMKLCDPLVTGEIYIRTPFRSYGYHNDVELNKACFIRSPFSNDGHDILHKTGDLGRWLPNGNIDLLGRNDRQVKIRGIRVELEEIESVLIKHTAVKEAVVMRKELSQNNLLLCAYITAGIEGDVDSHLILTDIKEYLSVKLPDYMVPGKLIRLEGIPRMPNGKVDYRLLPDPLAEKEIIAIPPRDDTERKLEKIWIEVLGIEKIGVKSQFFEIGGDSLKLMSLIAKIHRDFDVRLSLGQMFNHSTIASQAKIIKEIKKEDKYVSIVKTEKKESYALTSAQNRLYIIQQMDLKSVVYNMHYTVVLEGELHHDRLEEAFKKLINRHESLKTSFKMTSGKLTQVIHDDAEFEIEFFEINNSSKPGQKEQEQEITIIKDFIRPFDLNKVPLFRTGLIKVDEKKHILILDLHHIIGDALSMEMFVKETTALYEGVELPPMRIQYQDYSEWKNSEQERKRVKKQQEYWLEEFKKEIPVLDLPLDFPRPKVQTFEGRAVPFNIGKEQTQKLKAFASSKEVTLFMLLLTILYIFISKISGQTDIIIGTPITGRDHEDLFKIIGVFANTLSLRNYPKGEKTFIEFLLEVKKKALAAFENQLYQFEDLVDQVIANRDFSRNPLFDVLFTFYDMKKTSIGSTKETNEGKREKTGGLKLKPYGNPFRPAKLDLILNGIELKENLAFTFVYCTKLFKYETLQKFVKYFKKIVSSILENPGKKISEIEILEENKKQDILTQFNVDLENE